MPVWGGGGFVESSLCCRSLSIAFLSSRLVNLIIMSLGAFVKSSTVGPFHDREE